MPAAEASGQVVADLSRCELTAKAPPADLERLAEVLSLFTAPPGRVLMRRGEPAEGFVLLTAGTVEVSIDGGQARVLSAGSILGEISLLRRGRHRATVTALTEVRGLTGNRNAFDRLLSLPGVRGRLLTGARQRLVAGLPPVPVVLIDGTTVHLRPVRPDDAERFVDAAARASPGTLFRRFFSTAPPSTATARMLTEIDYVDHFAWAADDEHGSPIGGVSYVLVETDIGAAEISFSIVDEFQGRGLGTIFMGAIAVAARHNAVARFVAEVLVENMPMRAILARAGMVFRPAEDGVLRGECPVPDPSRMGMADETAAALDALVEEAALGAWHVVDPR